MLGFNNLQADILPLAKTGSMAEVGPRFFIQPSFLVIMPQD